MASRQVLAIGAIAWAVVGAPIALASLGATSDDARLLVGVLSVAGPLSALLASRALVTHRDRPAGFLLLLSVATPTYFLWVVNVPALVVGLALVIAPTAVVRRSRVGHQ